MNEDIVAISPVVLLSISDHITRLSLKPGTSAYPAFGALLGSVETACQNLEIRQSVQGVERQGHIDLELLRARLEQYSEIHPKDKMVGFYIVSTNHSDGVVDGLLSALSGLVGSSEYVQLSVKKTEPLSVFLRNRTEIIRPLKVVNISCRASSIVVSDISKLRNCSLGRAEQLNETLSGGVEAVSGLCERLHAIHLEIESGQFDPSLLAELEQIKSFFTEKNDNSELAKTIIQMTGVMRIVDANANIRATRGGTSKSARRGKF